MLIILMYTAMSLLTYIHLSLLLDDGDDKAGFEASEKQVALVTLAVLWPVVLILFTWQIVDKLRGRK